MANACSIMEGAVRDMMEGIGGRNDPVDDGLAKI
jgi:hypothetical protein